MLLYDGKHLTTVNGDNTLRYGYSLRHYQNGTWANVPLVFLKTAMSVSDLDAQEPGEVWLVGIDTTVVNNSQSGFAEHYSNGVWTSYVGAALGAHTPWFQSISEVSPTDVWASAGSGLYHFDGARWTQASIQGKRSGKVNDLPLDIGVIVMVSPTQGWAFPHPSYIPGYEETQEEALRYENGVWRWAAIPLQGATKPLPITSFAPSSPTQGWAIAFQVINGFPQYLLLYNDGDSWGVVRQQS
jgi:hypothetical protein